MANPVKISLKQVRSTWPNVLFSLETRLQEEGDDFSVENGQFFLSDLSEESTSGVWSPVPQDAVTSVKGQPKLLTYFNNDGYSLAYRGSTDTWEYVE